MSSDEAEFSDCVEFMLRVSSTEDEDTLVSSRDEADDEDSPRIRRSSQLVEKRLLSFYDHQLEHPPHQRQASPHKTPHEELPIHKAHAYPCHETHKTLPSDPSIWPQRPVMLRPTPNTYTNIRGIRRANSTEYQHFPGFCAGCILPINTGTELPGQSLVIDFESKHFVGTVLMRIKEAPSCVSGDACGEESYFDGKKRRFQAVVKGKFKSPLRMSECVTGQVFTRPAGSLPPRWVVTSFVKFVSTLSPQLEVCLHGVEPRFLSPLVATAHTVLEKPTTENTRVPSDESSQDEENASKSPGMSSQDDNDDRLYNYQVYAGAHDIEAHIEEPPATDPTSLMKHINGASQLFDAGSIARRQKLRKKSYNQISAQRAEEPCFQLDKEYCFEFYQHLLVFGDSLALDMGRPIGQVNLAPITDGQPIKFVSAHRDAVTGELEELWSFDIWHESLYPYAHAAEDAAEYTE